MASRSSRSPVLKNLLVVGSSLLVGGLAGLVAVETRLIVSPYEAGGHGCVAFHAPPPSRAPVQDLAGQPRANSQHRRKPPADEHLFIPTATGEMRTSGTDTWNNASSP
jgi:hypothetical protein